MLWVYSVYGLRIDSNLSIPGLVPLQETSKADVQVRLQSKLPDEVVDCRLSEEPWYVSSYKDEKGEHVLKASRLLNNSYFRFSYSDGMEFIVDREGSKIWSNWPDGLGIEDAAIYLLGPVMGFALRLRGTVCLHASVIAVGDEAIALAGPAGAGKSTTAAAFARLGNAVLSDDLAALAQDNGNHFVQPAYPCIRLWPSSVEVLYGSRDALPRLVPADASWDKCYLDLRKNKYDFREQKLPLAAIYFLEDRSDDAAAPFVESLSPSAGFVALVGNSYSNQLLDKDMRAHEFASLNRIVNSVPFYRVVPHTDPARLSRLCEVILESFTALNNFRFVAT